MSKKNTNIKDRVLYFAEMKEVSKQEFFRKTNLNYSNFTGKSKESDLNSSSIAEILLIYPDLNSDWLLTGNGEMLKSPSNSEDKNTFHILSNSHLLKMTDLGLILTDNMKFLSFILEILKKEKYPLTVEQKENIKFYRSLEIDFDKVKYGGYTVSPEDLENITRIIRSSLFGFINEMILITAETLNISPFADLDEYTRLL